MEGKMANGLGKDACGLLFSDEELREMSSLKRGEGFVEVMCGCTSRRYGDAVGMLRVFPDGDLLIRCQCTPGCEEDNLTPSNFEKHSGRDTPRRWKTNIWVMVNGKKVPLLRTVLLKYHNLASKSANGSHKGPKGRACHRDEFVRCTSCKKERRFKLRSKEECRAHHDALAELNWKCSDFPFGKITCEDDEERATRRALRGCTKTALCRGCTTCVCFGCEICRFSDCECQTCVDFNRNADI